jgi:DNA-binding Xre family transcriptional regulator
MIEDDMPKVQFLKTEAGEIAILPRKEYERLATMAMSEDAGTRRIVRRARAAVARGEDVILPKAVADRLIDENPIRVIREWRDMTQSDLTDAAGMTQGYLSDLETGRRRGTAESLAKLARALRVPLDLLVP